MFNREWIKIDRMLASIISIGAIQVIYNFIGLLLVYTLKEWLNCV
ncbi:putative membrane protein [Acinetobacter sp. 766875]|nr:putative membrane protein [Acinetobacter sp. 766875]